MILTDNETKVDLLNNEAIAATIIKLLRDRPDQPVTVGVHGDWGAGKSSVLEMIEAGFEGEAKVLCLKFNGWRFQGFEDAKIALIEGIVTGLIDKRPALTRAGETVKDIFRRIDWLKLAKKGGGLAFTAFTGIPTPDQIQAIVGTLEGFVADPSKLATKDNVEAAIDGVKGLLKPKGEGDSTNVPEEINAFRKAFDDLLEKAGVEQLVVLIDDLDRCLPDTAIETLEAVRLFVFTSRTAFVVAADEAMIEYAVRKHFPDLPDTTGPQTYARNYLEKLIQVPFRIPALGDTETRIYVTLLLVGAELGDNDPAFNTLIGVARERLKRPWTSGALDAASVRTALGDKASRANNALALSDQIGPILASGTKGNPRQIKRFLNTLVLRQRTAEARGFGDDVKLPVLAKLMLAERFIPRLFDQIAAAAAAAPDGKCPDLAALEAAATAKEEPRRAAKADKAPAGGKSGDTAKPAPKLEAVKTTESALLSEWLSSPAIKAWAAVPTSIGDEDLRPYLFVAKDRKDYFGAASVLGHLAAVVEQLFGGKFAVQGLEPDLKRLAPPEAAQVFEAVRGRIVGGDSFDTEPPGTAGLAILVKAHPTLQGNLVDFLDALPRDRLGPWVCSGWEGVLKDPDAVQRFDRLLQAWGKDGGPMLKVAATGVLRTRQGGR
ncbi:Qat anti-phage system ATPase QatA [Sinorhizobium meliloti]|jgi:predicted KAP-like P-loop ATPase|uniref:Qat anti-phage system ATPase QatA n=1 Tax=Rhizobium meliloti TaxID=382 RepID=UPI000AC99200|nr:Qat anti-phage system ATPase QatA [Sinorhizobium meliloti]RVO59162.1 NTPase KAP [Sinorhizobium meliloti]HET6377267.1 Qat anti-phage system ATPase QatA [Methylocella sp.]